MKKGDRSTIWWARMMDSQTQIAIKTNTTVAAGSVNQISRREVRVGEKRISRSEIVSVRKLIPPYGTINAPLSGGEK